MKRRTTELVAELISTVSARLDVDEQMIDRIDAVLADYMAKLESLRERVYDLEHPREAR